jgi:hypothetical protein
LTRRVLGKDWKILSKGTVISTTRLPSDPHLSFHIVKLTEGGEAMAASKPLNHRGMKMPILLSSSSKLLQNVISSTEFLHSVYTFSHVGIFDPAF